MRKDPVSLTPKAKNHKGENDSFKHLKLKISIVHKQIINKIKRLIRC